MNAELVYHGVALMVCAGAGLSGVLYQLHHQLVARYHDTLWADPLTAPRSLVERHHLRRPCSECSLLAELSTTRLVTRP